MHFDNDYEYKIQYMQNFRFIKVTKYHEGFVLDFEMLDFDQSWVINLKVIKL
jgi:hypothetical protein